MKKIILLLLFVPFIGFSQDCKFEKNEIDPFYKTKVVNTKKRVIVDVLGRTVVFQFLYNVEPSIKIEYTLGGSSDAVVIKGNKTMFLLNNNDVINFDVNEDQEGKIKEFLGSYLKEFNFIFPLSTDDLNKIKTIGIKTIRLETKEKTYDFEVRSKKDVVKINSIIDCFLNEINK
ncbi:hypothetical protein AAGV28_07210 [Flavobacterium sp. FZUC8N2.13]|uniref:Uncharacterized protein n=1 Tax=Flavobacterium zubiriense TaxID=3138075 RepID=A0ABV4TAN5_9FLAO